jgi:hypothetical protein
MKIHDQKLVKATVLATLLLALPCTVRPQGQNIESMPPVVTKTIPESGARDVAPGEVEIKVTFSKQMSDGSWSWSSAWKDSVPEMVGKPRYDADHKTCIARVKLEPGKTYAWWLNSANFHNFKDATGHPAVPYLLIFKAASK